MIGNSKQIRSMLVSDYFLRIASSPVFTIVVFSFLLFIRIIYLNADISPLKNPIDVLDEGYWTANARSMVLHGSFDLKSLLSAPLFYFLQFICFKLFGIGFFQARLLSAISGWLTIIVIYLLIKRYQPKYVALLFAFLLGITNELLMYNRIAFPESLQILSFSLCFLFWDMGKQRIWYQYLAGTFFSLTFLSKMSAIYYAPAIIVLFILEKLRNEVEFKNIAIFILGAITLFLPWFIFFGFHGLNYPEIIGALSSKMLRPGTNILGNISNFSGNYLLGTPSLILLVYILFLYIFYSLPGATSNFKVFLKSLSRLELIAASWIFGGIPLLAMSSDQWDRRYAIFIPPLVIIAATFFSKSAPFNAGPSRHLFSMPSNRFRLILSMLLFFFLLFTFIPRINNFLTMSLLLIPIVVFMIHKYSHLIGSPTKPQWTDYLLFISMALLTLPLLKISSSKYTAPGDFIFPNEPASMIFFIVGALILLFFNYIAFIKRDTHQVVSYIAILLLACNLIINAIWLIRPTFTLYNASKQIEEIANTEDVVYGCYAHLLSIENATCPVWIVLPPQEEGGKKGNPYKDAADKLAPKYIIISTDNDFNYFDIKDINIANKHSVPVTHFKIFPNPLSNRFLVNLTLYELVGHNNVY